MYLWRFVLFQGQSGVEVGELSYSITAVIFQSQKFEKSGIFEKLLQSLTELLERTLKNKEMCRDLISDFHNNLDLELLRLYPTTPSKSLQAITNFPATVEHRLLPSHSHNIQRLCTK